jgi:MFS family permease
VAGRLLIDLSPLTAHPPYRRLWLGQLLAQGGRQATALALPYQVYAATGSPLAIGGLAAVTIVALVLLALPAGGLADTRDRRWLILIAQAGQVVVSGALAIIAIQPNAPLLTIYALAFASAAFTVLDRPARRAAVPRLVDPVRLPAALILDSALVQVAKVGGPAVAGLLILATGVAAVYVVEAIAFALAFVLATRLPRLAPTGAHRGLTVRSLIDGLRFVRRTPVVMSAFVIDLAAMVFGLPVALFPIIATDIMGGGADVLGLLVAAPAVGAIVGSLLSGWVGRVQYQGRGVIAAVVVWAVAIIGFGLSLSVLPLALAFLALAGAADIVSTVFRGSILQLATPDAMRGRVSGLQILFFQGGPRLGDIEATTVAAVAGAPFSVISGGVICLLGAAVVALRYPALVAYQAVNGVARPAAPADTTSSRTPDRRSL